MKELLRFVEEDLGYGDITTESVLPGEAEALGEVVARQRGVLAGMAEALALLEHFSLSAEALKRDGDGVSPGEAVLRVEGSAAKLLMLERVVLNLLMRMSGIATATRRLAEVAQRYGVTIAGTRKTTPGFRYFEKRAIAIGGGDTHRFRLDDAVLIKDNHLALVELREAVTRAKRAGFTRKVEVEVANAEQALEALEAGADIVMLDNFSVEEAARAIPLIRERHPDAVIELSGGVTPENIESYARLRPDVISTGYITTRTPWLDMSLAVRR